MLRLKALASFALAATSMLITASADGAGADIKHSGLAGSISKFGPIGGVYAYSLGSNTCNVGDLSLSWINHGTPGIAMNAYRLHNGRFVQIGLGNAKTACCVGNSANTLCNNPPMCSSSGFGLRPGCLDTYSAGFNAGQANLAPRSFMNPQSGVISTAYPSTSGDAIFRRMQIRQDDMTSATYPGALYFVEGHYVCQEDAAANNDLNNASYSRVTVDASFTLTPTTPTTSEFHAGTPAIYAWRDQGLGPNTPDPSVTILNLDVPNEGRFIIGQKTIDNGDGTWRYEYAIYNFNSDRAGGSFAVPVPTDANVTNIGFSSPDYHSGEVYANTDWIIANNGYEVRWSSPQTEAQNVNTNAMRWGTLYNFWFTCDQPPVSSHVKLDLFKAAAGCQPVQVSAVVNAPGSACTADAVRSGTVDIDDLLAVIGGWGACRCQFTCAGDVVANSQVDIDDLLHVIAGWGPCQ